MEEKTKEVHFCFYCPKCEYFEKQEDEDPCFECLANPVNIDSHKPVKFKEAGT